MEWQKLLSQKFTFHNVSINTDPGRADARMLLQFTFHNVSINTPGTGTRKEGAAGFTFHNVSINTQENDDRYVNEERIYIPQCFY